MYKTTGIKTLALNGVLVGALSLCGATAFASEHEDAVTAADEAAEAMSDAAEAEAEAAVAKDEAEAEQGAEMHAEEVSGD